MWKRCGWEAKAEPMEIKSSPYTRTHAHTQTHTHTHTHAERDEIKREGELKTSGAARSLLTSA